MRGRDLNHIATDHQIKGYIALLLSTSVEGLTALPLTTDMGEGYLVLPLTPVLEDNIVVTDTSAGGYDGGH